ncbi:hypothetical protein J2802_004422 [Paraburkholderia caribensis]|nr:hypothetical protein [Paraburkholderia caribensis]
MLHSWTILRTAQHAPASRGENGALRLDGALAGQFGTQPDRPCGPPLSPRLRRGSSCGSIRARGARDMRGWSTTALACRGRACGRTAIVAWASPIGARRAEGNTSRGAGGRQWNAGHRAGAVHALAGWAAQPSTGGRGNDDSSSTTLFFWLRPTLLKPDSGGHASSEFFATEHQSILISDMPKSYVGLLSGQRVGQEGARAVSATTTTCEDMASCG